MKVPAEEIRPPKIACRIPSAPKIRQIYWCDFWQEAQLPEFWKRRPVIILSYKNTLSGPCTVIPTSSQPQGENQWAMPLTTTIDGTPSWAICNHPITIAVSRLTPAKHGTPRLPEEEFAEILIRLYRWLPKLEA